MVGAALLLTLALLLSVAGLVWFFLVRPLVGKAENVMVRVDESFERELERERLSQEERQKAEEELRQQVGEPPEAL